MVVFERDHRGTMSVSTTSWVVAHVKPQEGDRGGHLSHAQKQASNSKYCTCDLGRGSAVPHPTRMCQSPPPIKPASWA